MFTVSLLLWTLLVASTSSDQNQEESSDTGMVINFIDKIIKPFLDDNHHTNDSDTRLRTAEHTVLDEIKNVIRLKVMQLKPMLQDSENHNHTKIETDKSLNLEGNDETVILDVMPEKARRTKVKLAVRENQKLTETLKKKIEYYKQIRNHITLLLYKENTSNLTNRLITTTLDGMLALLIKKQCKWKSVYTGDLMKYLDMSSRNSMQNLKNNSRVLDEYRLACYLKPKEKNVETDRYRSVQSSIPSSDKRDERDNRDTVNHQDQCRIFIICSDELRDFLTITYNYLNKTAVATFQDYIAMYMKDVQKQTKPSHNVISSELDYLSTSAENEVKKIFINELEHFTLDENKNKIENIQHIKDFIKATTVKIKSRLFMLVNDHLNAVKIKVKLFSTVKKDLIVNLKMNMDNLCQLIGDKICEYFVLCNGIGTRRFNKPGEFTPKDDKIYFKVKLSFDAEMKDALARYQNLKSPARRGKTFSIYDFGKSLIDKIGRRNGYINVTRTSVGSTATTESVASSENMKTDQFF